MKTTAFALAAAFALTAAGAGVAHAQPDQDHAAHHADTAPVQSAPAQPAPTQTAPKLGAGMPMQPGGTMPGMQGMMGGDMQQMMRMMQAMRKRMADQGMGGPMAMMGMDHIEGRIAFLKVELAITDAQQPQWNAFADALRAQADRMRTMQAQMMQSGMPEAWPDRLAMMESGLSARLEALRAIEPAARAFYAVLSPEQQKNANELLGHPTGGAMGRM